MSYYKEEAIMTLTFDDQAYDFIYKTYGKFVLINPKNITWGGSSFELLSFSEKTPLYNEYIYKDITFYMLKEHTVFFPYLEFDFDIELIITTFC